MATTTGKLLTQDERNLCEKIAALNIVLVSRRAQALLLLDDGYTQAKSSERSSLTIGQLRYLLRLFKKKRIAIFPEKLFIQLEKEQEKESTPTSELETQPETEPEQEGTPISEPEAEPEIKPEASGKTTKKEKKEKKKKKKKKEKKPSTKKAKQSKKERKKKKGKKKKK